jgi:hypothetical protein
MKKQIANFALSLGAFGAVATASAQIVITSTNDPALNGAGLIDFSSATIGSYSSLVIDGVTITAPGNTVRVQNTYSGDYNTTGNYLDNNAGSASTIDFTFDSPQVVFGFNYGALDDQWTLNVYDSDNNLIDATTVEPNHGSNAGEFIGIASSSANIAWASFTDSSSGDWILLDNLRFTPTEVPEPSTLALAGLGGLGLLLFRRRK